MFWCQESNPNYIVKLLFTNDRFEKFKPSKKWNCIKLNWEKTCFQKSKINIYELRFLVIWSSKKRLFSLAQIYCRRLLLFHNYYYYWLEHWMKTTNFWLSATSAWKPPDVWMTWQSYTYFVRGLIVISCFSVVSKCF